MTTPSTISLSQLEQIAGILSVAHDRESLIHGLEAILEEVSPAEYTGLYLFNPATRALEMLSARGFSAEERREAERTAMERHPGRVFLSHAPILIQDVAAEPERSQSSARSFEVRSRLFLPVMARGRCVGTLGLASTRPHAFGEAHVAALSFLVQLAGLVYGQIEEGEQRRALEARLHHEQRLDAVNRLAGGLAHELNNHLMVILGVTETALEEVPAGGLRDDLEIVQQASQRAAGVVRRLLKFSRRDARQVRRFRAQEALLRGLHLLRPLLREDISLEVSAQGDDLLEMDPSAFEQVLLNLAINACEAMPRGGALRITLGPDDGAPPAHLGRMPDRMIFQTPSPHKGRKVRLLIEDSGVGMTPEVLARLGEPFFTTRASGVGTGLGLATVADIAREQGGALSAWSSPGAGSALMLCLPAVPGAPDPESQDEEAPITQDGEATVLVVEDEGMIRRLLERVLRQHGFRVLLAKDGAEGLALFQDHQHEIDLVISDMIMPNLNGLEMIEQILALRPALPVLLMSGYTDELAQRESFSRLQATLLRKPFSIQHLLGQIRGALERSPAS
jgi:two-component system cell cycle sensor histidine kinase/response regulator CckA